jgi:hypothetical protein
MIIDVGNDNDQYPVIPSKYYKHLHMKLDSFDTIKFKLSLYNFLKTEQELIVNVTDITNMISIKLKDLESDLLEKVNDRIQMLEFYDFLDVDEKSINQLAMENGILLEQIENNIEIIPEIFSIIIEQYPSLGYHPKYNSICKRSYKRIFDQINENKHKYASSYHIRYFFTKHDMGKYCLGGNYEHVKYLFDNRIGLNDSQDDMNYYFMNACKSENLKLIQFIFSKGVTINDELLLIACSYDNIAVFEFLFDNFNGEISFILFEICRKNNLRLLKFLISRGVDINQSSDIVKSCKDNVEIVDYLYQNGLDIHIDNDFPLRSAVYHGHVNMCRFLLSKGANVNANKEEPLIWSIIRNTSDTEIFKLLIGNGADINFRLVDTKTSTTERTMYCISDLSIVNHVLNKNIIGCHQWVDYESDFFRHGDISRRKQYFSELVDFLDKFTR